VNSTRLLTTSEQRIKQVISHIFTLLTTFFLCSRTFYNIFLNSYVLDDLASKRPQIRSIEQLETLSKEEAIAVFKDALKDAGVSSTWRWDDAQRVTVHDIRIKALKTIAERKQIFNQFIDE
jgi:FF domain